MVYLYDRACEFTQLPVTRKDCAYLNQYYIESRYPADTPLSVTEQDVEKCMNIAMKMMRNPLPATTKLATEKSVVFLFLSVADFVDSEGREDLNQRGCRGENHHCSERPIRSCKIT